MKKIKNKILLSILAFSLIFCNACLESPYIVKKLSRNDLSNIPYSLNQNMNFLLNNTDTISFKVISNIDSVTNNALKLSIENNKYAYIKVLKLRSINFNEQIMIELQPNNVIRIDLFPNNGIRDAALFIDDSNCFDGINVNDNIYNKVYLYQLSSSPDIYNCISKLYYTKEDGIVYLEIIGNTSANKTTLTLLK